MKNDQIQPAIKKINNLKDFKLLIAGGYIDKSSLEAALSIGIDELVRVLDCLARTRLPHALLLASEWLAARENLGRLIQAVLEDPKAYSRVHQESYYHQNGFDKIVLLSGKGFKVRLHHFHAQAGQVPMENIHDHRWAFASTLIQGGFRMHLFEENPFGEEERRLHVYQSARVGHKYATQEIGFRRLKVVKQLEYRECDSYIMLPHELHSIIHIPNMEAVTLIVTGNNERDTCKLYAKGPIHDEQKETKPYDPIWLANKLERMSTRPLLQAS